jgi:hypothetical protein
LTSILYIEIIIAQPASNAIQYFALSTLPFSENQFFYAELGNPNAKGESLRMVEGFSEYRVI